MTTKLVPLIALVLAHGARVLLAEDAATSPSPSSSNKRTGEFYGRFFEDARMKEVFHQQAIAQLKQIYGDFVSERHLSPDQAKLFFDLFLEMDASDVDDATNFFSGQESKADTERIENQAAAKQAEKDQQLRTLLGENNFAALEAYEKTGSERLALVQIREQLDLRSTSLREDQARTLLQIMLEERAHTPPMAFDPRCGRTRKKMLIALQGDNAERYYELQTDLNQRILRRAGAILSSEQFAALDRFQKQHLQVQKVAIDALRKMMERKEDDADPADASTPPP